jgi:hypothetical protein
MFRRYTIIRERTILAGERTISAGERTISAGERPQTYALDRVATGTGFIHKIDLFKISSFSFW